MSLLFRFCDLKISLTSFNSLNLFLMPFGLIINKCWSYYFALQFAITPYSIALVETLSCQILELLKLLSHVFSGYISERLVPKGHLVGLQNFVFIILTKDIIHLSQSIDCDFCGWSTNISVKHFYNMMQ